MRVRFAVALAVMATTVVLALVILQAFRPDQAPATAFQPVVEAQEKVYAYMPPNNGADPLWSYGSTLVVRYGEDVFASGLETLEDVKPPNNVRWVLFKRTDDGWEVQQRDQEDRTREPCPLALYSDGRLWMSANPTLEPAEGHWGAPAQPQLLQFAADDAQAPYRRLIPEWDGSPPFNEHSYRGLAADGLRHELVLFNINSYIAQHWAFLDEEGVWRAAGRLTFPWSSEYHTPLRLCYPTVALSNRSAIVMAVSDIIEPVDEWQEFKIADDPGGYLYVYRRLFYAWTPDIATVPFSQWIEFANQERTAGHVHNEDVWLAEDGTAHLLWIERNLDPQLKKRFFPEKNLTISLEHAIVRDGQITNRGTLIRWEQGHPGEVPIWARFHATPEDRLFVLYSSYRRGLFRARPENWLMELFSDGTRSASLRVDLNCPFTQFVTAAERAGSPRSSTLDVIGRCTDEPIVRYARIKIY